MTNKISNKNQSRRNTGSINKKAIVLESEKKSRMPLMMIVVAVILIAVGAGLYLSLNDNQPSPVQAPESISGQARIVKYPVAMFADGKARHFEYSAGEISIRYFILKSSDGVIRAAFDACDVCWPANKGYFQAGDHMVCRNCGRRFASILVNEVKGGCNPAPLTRSVTGDQLVIKIDDILLGKQYFDFSEKA